MECGGRVFPREMIESAAERQGGACACCGYGIDAQSRGDHIIPWSKGGPTEEWNLQALCISCNSVKGDRDPISWAMANNVSFNDDFYYGLSEWIKSNAIPRPKSWASKPAHKTVKSSGPKSVNRGVKGFDDISSIKSLAIGEYVRIGGLFEGSKVHDRILKLEDAACVKFSIKFNKSSKATVKRIA